MKRQVSKNQLVVILTVVSVMTLFQNCAPVKFNATSNEASSSFDEGPGTPGACGGISCSLDPLTYRSAVTTVLLALGDEVNNQLVIKGVSAQLIAESVVRYSTPQADPKILFVRDAAAGGESASDTDYVAHTLLARYNVTYLQEPASGISDRDLAGYDLVWFNNPGAPMGYASTRDTLIRFQGGVVLQGDDLSWGSNFSLQSLTGLTNEDNGTTIVCDNNSYRTDNNQGTLYAVNLNSGKFTGTSSTSLSFSYGNDIDNTVLARSDIEVLAYAKGSPADCSKQRPAIVRYFK